MRAGGKRKPEVERLFTVRGNNFIKATGGKPAPEERVATSGKKHEKSTFQSNLVVGIFNILGLVFTNTFPIMKKFLKYTAIILGSLILLGVLAFYAYYGIQSNRYHSELGPEAAELTEDGHRFRDLNKNGKLDPYEDRRQPVEARVEDLLNRMTLEEKAGAMFITMIAMTKDGSLMERPSVSDPFSFISPINSEMLAGWLMNHFNVFQVAPPRAMAEWHNNMQRLAERTCLGIPVTIASDPRHSFSENIGANLFAGEFSEWCEPIGLAATRDSALVARFGDIARQEYLAVGIRLALHPMADLATEPRWARINGTFGEDAELAAQMVQAYILGFQGDTLGAQSVACMTKHFSGGGPQKEGWDAHFDYGAEQVYPGNNFDYHLIPFEAAFRVNTAQIMPYYGIPVGQTSEDVGFAFNKEIITDLLRKKYQFDGVVCTDWGVLSDRKVLGQVFMKSTGWGVPDLTPAERMLKALEAGVDQFGGEAIPEVLVQLVEEGKVTESRLDMSVRRLLRDKFVMGLFDNPYVDADRAAEIVGRSDFQEAGALAQRKSIVLLKNAEGTLPLSEKTKIYIENIDPEVAAQYGEVVESPEEADFAVLRLQAPYQPRTGSNNFLENFFHQGDLDFKGEEKERILSILETVSTIVDIYLDRPAVIPDIAAQSAGLLANFGARDEALLDIVFGRFRPTGRLPFEMPASMEAVRGQKEDVPFDSGDPVFEFGHGLEYTKEEL